MLGPYPHPPLTPLPPSIVLVHQLDTFAAWAGRSSDISFYLNSHHIDFHCWAMLGMALAEQGLDNARAAEAFEKAAKLTTMPATRDGYLAFARSLRTSPEPKLGLAGF